MADSGDSIESIINDAKAYVRFLAEQGFEYRVPAIAGANDAPARPRTMAIPSQPPTAMAARGASKPAAKKPPTPTPATGPLPAALADDERDAALAALYDDIAKCQACSLCRTRNNTVPGGGPASAELLFIGEGPGADEDRQGVPFVGRAGQKLNDMIAYLGLTRDDVYICNILKCRPPGNRNPSPDEAAICRHYLDRQIELVNPSVICLLGSIPLKYITNNMRAAITRVRGQWIDYRGVPTMPTFHPAYLLRSYTVANRKAVASDFDALRDKLKEQGKKVGDKPGANG